MAGQRLAEKEGLRVKWRWERAFPESAPAVSYGNAAAALTVTQAEAKSFTMALTKDSEAGAPTCLCREPQRSLAAGAACVCAVSGRAH